VVLVHILEGNWKHPDAWPILRIRFLWKEPSHSCSEHEQEKKQQEGFRSKWDLGSGWGRWRCWRYLEVRWGRRERERDRRIRHLQWWWVHSETRQRQRSGGW
jgi:hypothetical protein